jgi:hypothetical protein
MNLDIEPLRSSAGLSSFEFLGAESFPNGLLGFSYATGFG